MANEDGSYLVCKKCSRSFDPTTGEIPKGWDNAKWVVTSNEICKSCSVADEENKKVWP